MTAISSPIPNWIEAVNEETKSHPSLVKLVGLVSKGEAVGPWHYQEAESRIHPVFHVSLLKKKLGENVTNQVQLPIVNDEDGKLCPRPQEILDHRMKRHRAEILVHWQGLSPAEATWENLEYMKKQFPDYILQT
ncbi:hypothetical protein EZV62_011141 [Acer yangbiense]|uniref:Chromo domain-containing protein n=1 Tax=Acer yangbiense TaxID=1000413 RepID=A0A5C7I4F3_9ROSI|nr:hypothetical protein EZV62_011141 [Acer yangbiense]